MTATKAVISSASDRVPEVEGASPLDHLRVLEPDVSAVQLGKVRDALAEHDRHEADADSVPKPELERRRDPRGARDRDVLVAGDLPRLRDGRLHAIDERR